eukprot:m.202435 g.202435  ORF g.202435 m.202435 type:complete len:373 (+) comp25246_c0_seq9:108-1226(+)
MPARTRSGPATPTARTQRSDASPPLPVVTRAEVARHSTEGDLWVIVNDGVYDMTRFLRHHPGGPAPLRYSGADATAIFTKVHKVGTLAMRGGKLKVAQLDPAEVTATKPGTDTETTAQSVYDAQADIDGYDVRRFGDPNREFGDHMAQEGETSHIPIIILLMYLAMAGWSVLVSWFTGCSPWTIPLNYICGMAAFYSWHALAHSERVHLAAKRWGVTYLAELHEIHMEHHLEKFPASNFYGTAAGFAMMYPDGKPTIWTLMDLTRTTNIARGTAASKELDAATKTPHSPLAHEFPLLASLVRRSSPVGCVSASTVCEYITENGASTGSHPHRGSSRQSLLCSNHSVHLPHFFCPRDCGQRAPYVVPRPQLSP